MESNLNKDEADLCELKSVDSYETPPSAQPIKFESEESQAIEGRESMRGKIQLWFIGQNITPLLILVLSFFCGMFTQYQSVAACVFLLHSTYLAYIYTAKSVWAQWLGTMVVGVGLSLSMSQLFRADDGGPTWSWFSFGIVAALQIGAAHIYLICARIHFRLVTRLPYWAPPMFCYPVLVASAYSIMSLYSPIGSQCSMAYSMAEWQSFVQVVSVFGITGLNFIILFVATCGTHALLIGSKRHRVYSFYSGFCVFLLTSLFGSFRILIPSMYQVSVEVSATAANAWVEAACIVQDGETDMLNKTAIVLKERSVRFVVWSEAAGLMYYPENSDSSYEPQVSDFYKAISDLAVNNDALIGATYGIWQDPSNPNSSTQFNMLAMADPVRGEILFKYAKRYPVPVMESEVVASSNPLAYARSSTLGPLNAAICFDLDHPEYIRSGSSTGILVQPANTWGIVGKYHAISSSFRAIENGMFLIRCGSNGPSGVWDPYGSILGYQTRKDASVVYFDVPVNPQKLWTFYSHVGFVIDYILYAISIIYLIIFAITFSRWYRILLCLGKAHKNIPGQITNSS